MVGLDYAGLQATVTAVMEQVKQGTNQRLRRTVLTPPANPWEEPAEVNTDYQVKCVARRVDRRYENGVLIVETGDWVTFSVPEVEPLITDVFVIDDVVRSIRSLIRIPAAGTPVAYRAFVAS
jgi:hypothetical protein